MLTIAGSDPTGGAGIQADLAVFHSFAAYGLSVITAITAQNTSGVQRVDVLDASVVAQQLEVVLADVAIDAIKIGMLGNADIVNTVFATLAHYPTTPLVLDPVLRSSSGTQLLTPAGTQQLIKHFSACALLTPNSDELAQLVPHVTDTTKQACHLAERTGATLVVTGGHTDTHTIIIAEPSGIINYVPFVHHPTKHTHGTGCVFAAALTAYVAQGKTTQTACRLAAQYVAHAVQEAMTHPLVAHGHSPTRIPNLLPEC